MLVIGVAGAAFALALAGVWLGLRIASPGEYETQLARVSVRVTPSATGRLEAYVPLADWGVRLRPFSAARMVCLRSPSIGLTSPASVRSAVSASWPIS